MRKTIIACFTFILFLTACGQASSNTTKTCMIPGCEEKVNADGLCLVHYVEQFTKVNTADTTQKATTSATIRSYEDIDVVTPAPSMDISFIIPQEETGATIYYGNGLSDYLKKLNSEIIINKIEHTILADEVVIDLQVEITENRDTDSIFKRLYYNILDSDDYVIYSNDFSFTDDYGTKIKRSFSIRFSDANLKSGQQYKLVFINEGYDTSPPPEFTLLMPQMETGTTVYEGSGYYNKIWLEIILSQIQYEIKNDRISVNLIAELTNKGKENFSNYHFLHIYYVIKDSDGIQLYKNEYQQSAERGSTYNISFDIYYSKIPFEEGKTYTLEFVDHNYTRTGKE